jgi:chloride channel 3/4/5
MKKELYTLNVSGSTIQEIEEELSRTDAKGFPIVTPDARQVIMGYIGRMELRYLMGIYVLFHARLDLSEPRTEKAKKMHFVTPDTTCAFAPGEADEEEGPHLTALRSAGPHIGIDEELTAEVIQSTASSEVLKLWPWVQQVRFLIVSRLALTRGTFSDTIDCFTAATA